MRRFCLYAGCAIMTALVGVSTSQAQFSLRVPFVRINIGEGGVYVRAPFVNVYVPPSPPVVEQYYTPLPAVETLPPPVVEGQPRMKLVPADPFPPVPQVNPNVPPIRDTNVPPQPLQAVEAPSLEQFSKTFRAKAGSYEVVIVNPISKKSETVRFTLPEGEPRRVLVRRDAIEFVYGIGRWVRIEFDRDGVQVTTR